MEEKKPPAKEIELPHRPKPISTWDCELELPQLMLVFKSGALGLNTGQWAREWHSLSHQTSGVACRHVDFYGTPLQPNGKTALGLAQLSESMYGSNLACFGLQLSEVNDYQKRLQALGLSCENTFKDLQEGYYPIDMPESLNEFVEDSLPQDLDDLLDWEGQHEIAKMIGILNRWQLAWISTNSD